MRRASRLPCCLERRNLPSHESEFPCAAIGPRERLAFNGFSSVTLVVCTDILSVLGNRLSANCRRQRWTHRWAVDGRWPPRVRPIWPSFRWHAGGYSRALSGRARALIRGRSAPGGGRVCMNILRADVTAIPWVSIGDEFLASPHLSPGFVARPARCCIQWRSRLEGRGGVLDSTSSTPK